MSRFDALLGAFPEARFHPEVSLLAWHPTGILDDDRADRVLEFLEYEEQQPGEPFHRFTDMTGLIRLDLSFDHLFTTAQRRKTGYVGPPIRSAFYAVRLLSVTIAQMYQELMQGSPIEVQVFRDRAAAAEWLRVPTKLLAPPAAQVA